MKMMHLEQATSILKKLYEVEHKNVLKARRAFKKINEELELFQKTKDEYIQKHGKDGVINQGTPEFGKAMKFVRELLNEEVTINWEPVFTEKELIELDIKLSLKDLDLLESIGILHPTN